MTHIPAKFRFPTLKKPRRKSAKTKGYSFRWNQLVRRNFLKRAAPVHHPTLRDRTTVRPPPHMATLGVPGERSGAAVQPGERGASKIVVPSVANIHDHCFESAVGRSILEFLP